MGAPEDPSVGDEIGAPIGGVAPVAEKPCPFCGEPIKATAKKCRLCGEWLDASMKDARRGLGAKPRGPILLQVWGVGIMVLTGLMALMTVAQTVMMIFMIAGMGRGGVGSMLPSMIAGLGFNFLFLFVLFRLGLGLFRGQRASVIGMGILWALCGVLSLFIASNEIVPGLIVLGVTSVMYGPPTVMGILRWDRLIWKMPSRGVVVAKGRRPTF